MNLSVIVVNHNTRILLKQSINSLIDACKHIDYELIIVDNASSDHSLEMLSTNFPAVKVIANDHYEGIAKANNQAMQLCTGDYILLVNADTLAIKDSIEKMIAFMDSHADAGGMSIRMLSPQGRFLPESIHGLTPAWGTFLKLIGFAKNLSKTRLYDRNRKDWVEEFRETEIDILNGACMMLRKSALSEIGLFDERFFMFGADVDLSYRLRLAGYKNYYYPKTYIINFENQDFAKLSWEYVRYFYGAMFIFAFKYLIRVPDIKVKGVPQMVPSGYEV